MADVDTSDDTTLYRRDWLYLVFILVIAAYTGGLIALHEFDSARFAAIVDLLVGVPLAPPQLFGQDCTVAEQAAGLLIIRHVNLLTLPMIAASALYHTVDRRALAKPVSKENLVFSAACWVALPAWLAASCAPEWLGGISSGIVVLMQDFSLGAAIYAVLLLSLCNGVSYLPAAGLLRLFRPAKVVP